MLRVREEYKNQGITERTGKVGKGREEKGMGKVAGNQVNIKNDVFLFIEIGEGNQKKKIEGWRGERIKKLELFTPL